MLFSEEDLKECQNFKGTEVDFNTFMRVLDSVSRITNIHCVATLYSIDFFIHSEVEKKAVCFASIDCYCQFFVKDVTKGDYNVEKKY